VTLRLRKSRRMLCSSADPMAGRNRTTTIPSPPVEPLSASGEQGRRSGRHKLFVLALGLLGWLVLAGVVGYLAVDPTNRGDARLADALLLLVAAGVLLYRGYRGSRN
jgi:hypothetical protein